MRFKIELKFSITHTTACARGQSLPQSLNNKLLFLFYNSPVRNKQNKLQNLFACVCIHVCVRGIWILSSCLSDRKTSAVKQRGQQHQSVLCLISAVLLTPSNHEIHTDSCASGMHALIQYFLVYTPTTDTQFYNVAASSVSYCMMRMQLNFILTVYYLIVSSLEDKMKAICTGNTLYH